MEILPVSAVIAAKNAERTIEQCLDSVKINNPAEIIIVDGNSTDKTVDIGKRYTEKIFSDGGKGFNSAQQIGAEQATQEYIAFIDSDMVMPQGLLAKLISELKASDCISMQAKIRPACLDTYWERAYAWEPKHTLLRRRSIGLSPAVLRKDTIMKYKLDSTVQVGSDYAFELMAKRNGDKLGVSSAFAYHYAYTNFKGLVKQRIRYGREMAYFIHGYGPWHTTSWPPLSMLYRLLLCLVNGKPNFIPFFIVHGVFETTGMVEEFFRLTIGREK